MDYTLPADITANANLVSMPQFSSRRPGGNVGAVPSGRALALTVSDTNPDWGYVPYNFQNTRRSKAFFRGLNKNGYDKKTLQAYLETSDIFSYDWDDIKRIYQKYAPGSLNSNSLVVYSGPLTPDHRQIRPYRFFMPDLTEPQSGRRTGYPDGCLYLGTDAPRNKRKLGHCRRTLCLHALLSAPCSGSTSRFCTIITKELSCGRFVLIISAGYQNKYKHPHTKVQKRRYDEKVIHFWVTKDRLEA